HANAMDMSQAILGVDEIERLVDAGVLEVTPPLMT
ncbi:MAG: hypothetical protein JWM76_4786, partial [Pseudonocardiales bacterium]|nr:hypothetical protein [Pseudonocardiales bacterium]